MKIAIIGTSPIAIVLYYFLSKNSNNSVHNFNLNDEIGGAWSCKELHGQIVNTKSNIIFPYSKKESEGLSSLAELIKCHSLAESFELETDYRPSFLVDYDLPVFFKGFASKDSIIHEEVVRLDEKNGEIIINSNLRYDLAYVPTHAKLAEITIDGVVYSTPYKLIQSKHLALLTKEDLQFPFYKEADMGSLDRIQYRRGINYNVLIGRVSKNFKDKDIESIIDGLSRKIEEKFMIHKEINVYDNYHRNQHHENMLISAIDKSKAIEYLHTAQFATSYMKLVSTYGN